MTEMPPLPPEPDPETEEDGLYRDEDE